MSILDFFKAGEAVATPVNAVGNVLDKLFTSDEEREILELAKQRLAQQPQIAQIELNKIEASHRSLFVAGWRPAIGWVCAIGLAFMFVLNPLLQWKTGKDGPMLPEDIILELVLALLGLGALRTYEKIKGRAK